MVLLVSISKNQSKKFIPQINRFTKGKEKAQLYYYHAADQRPINSTEKRMLFDFVGTTIRS